jgi:diketogulonate reductase-like aldo/keto reductase
LVGIAFGQQLTENENQNKIISSQVPLVTLNNGVQMPAVAAGTWKYNLAQVDTEIKNAISVGWNHVDTAHDYCENGSSGLWCPGSSVQVAVGEAIRDSNLERDQVFITTKVPGCGL